MKNFDFSLFAFLIVGFVFFTIIGTLSHEFGHYAMGKMLGYDVYIDYQSTHFVSNQEVSKEDNFLFILGGPLLTMLTGTIGLMHVFINRKTFYFTRKLSFIQWIMIFLASFWLRQLFNFFTAVIRFIKKGSFSIRSDESKLDVYFGFENGTSSTITALLSIVLIAFLFFKFIPKLQRLPFLVAGLIGGILGYILWFKYLGPIILP